MNVGWIKDLGKLRRVWEHSGATLEQPVSGRSRRSGTSLRIDGGHRQVHAPGAKVFDRGLGHAKAAYEQYLEVVKPSDASKEALEVLLKADQAVGGRTTRFRRHAEGPESDGEAGGGGHAGSGRPWRSLEGGRRSGREGEGEHRRGEDQQPKAPARPCRKVSQINMSGLVSQIQDMADAMWNAATRFQMSKPPARRNDRRPWRDGVEVPAPAAARQART